jgi:hypothetical protein
MEGKLTDVVMPFRNDYLDVVGPQGTVLTGLDLPLARKIAAALNTAYMLGLADEALKVVKK